MESPPHKDVPIQPRTQPRGRRLWLFRLITAIGVPLLCLVLLEGGLRVAGCGRSPAFLVPDEQPGWLRTNPDFLKILMGESVELQPLNFRISRRKPRDTIRVVVLGESAAQGIPAPAFGFASQLRAQLRAYFPGKNIEVINAGVAAISSHIVLRVARDLAEVEPDAFVVYMGNNDIVGPYGPGGTFLPTMPPRWVVRLSLFVRTTRTGQLLQNLLGALSARGRKLGVSAAGMETFVEQSTPPGDPRLAAVGRNFRANLADVIRTARHTGAKVVVCTLASNLKDCAPLLSRHQTDVSSADLELSRRSFERGVVEWRMGDYPAAYKDLTAALRLEPGYANTHFVLGQVALQMGDEGEARRALLESIRQDALGFRPGPMLNDIIRDLAGREPGVELVDAALLMGSDAASVAPPAGGELFVDHVHFNWAGSYRLGLALAERIASLLPRQSAASQGWLSPEGCAAAIGYTQPAQTAVLTLTEAILQSPPFNNQLTHCEDIARIESALRDARARTGDSSVLHAALSTVQMAKAQDPGNTFLPELEENLAVSLGLSEVALRAARHRRQAMPDTPALATGEALRLLQADRPAEALALLEATATSCPVRDLPKMGPVFVRYYCSTKQPAGGIGRIDRLFARAPGQSPHLLRGALLRSAGETAAAEREYRAALVAAPADQVALEALADLLTEGSRAAEMEEVCLAAVANQPQNHRNNLRAAGIMQNRGQEAEVIRLFLAAEKSGPVTAEIEMTLALKLASARRMEEGIQHLALARQLAQIEQNRTILEAIDSVLRRLHTRSAAP